jgi:hypothetical protein
MLRHGFFSAEALVQSQGSPHMICGRHNNTEIGSSLAENRHGTFVEIIDSNIIYI